MNTIATMNEQPIAGRVYYFSSVFFFVFGVLLTLGASYFFNGCNNGKIIPENVTLTDTSTMDLQQIQDAVVGYRRQVFSLNRTNSELEIEITDVKKALRQSAISNIGLRTKLERQVSQSDQRSDTLQLLNNCDSLVISATELMISCLERDSINNCLADALTRQVELKDSVILCQESHNSFLRLNNDRMLVENHQLATENFGLKKSIKHRKRANLLLSAGLTLLGGAVTYMTLNH